MAKVSFTKLKCKIDDSVKQIKFNDEITIEVKQYLPVQEKLALIGRVIMQAHEQDENYSNPIKVDVFRELEMVYAYTNISFTDKQKEDPAKLYDLLVCSGILKTIKDAIPSDEKGEIVFGIEDSIEAVYKYQNSVLGIIDNIKNGYVETDIDINKLQGSMEELSNSPLIKEILPLLGLN